MTHAVVISQKAKKKRHIRKIEQFSKMPTAIKTDHPYTWQSDVGLRKLPFSELEYYARAPTKTNTKNGIFNTVWLPVNASNRVVVDRQQDLMHMKYSYNNNNRLNLSAAEGKGSENGETIPANIRHCRRIIRERNTQLPVSYELTRRTLPKIEQEMKPTEVPEHVKIAMWKTSHNTMAPFASLGKPTCGYFFTRNVSHHKRLIGINATNTVKWRSNVDILNIKKDYKKTI